MEKTGDVSFPPDGMEPPEWESEYEAFVMAQERANHELTQSVMDPWERASYDA